MSTKAEMPDVAKAVLIVLSHVTEASFAKSNTSTVTRVPAGTGTWPTIVIAVASATVAVTVGEGLVVAVGVGVAAKPDPDDAQTEMSAAAVTDSPELRNLIALPRVLPIDLVAAALRVDRFHPWGVHRDRLEGEILIGIQNVVKRSIVNRSSRT